MDPNNNLNVIKYLFLVTFVKSFLIAIYNLYIYGELYKLHSTLVYIGAPIKNHIEGKRE